MPKETKENGCNTTKQTQNKQLWCFIFLERFDDVVDLLNGIFFLLHDWSFLIDVGLLCYLSRDKLFNQSGLVASIDNKVPCHQKLPITCWAWRSRKILSCLCSSATLSPSSMLTPLITPCSSAIAAVSAFWSPWRKKKFCVVLKVQDSLKLFRSPYFQRA